MRSLRYISVFSLTLLCLQPVLSEDKPLAYDSIIFQAFYWDVPAGGNWYNTIRSNAQDLKDAGFTHFWFPPPTKGAGGGYSMGYDLYDNYDLGQYDQKGTVETRFGSLLELQQAAAACGNVLIDLVANHMSGAEKKSTDPWDGISYDQGFQYVHDKFWKSAMDFHPGYPDDCDLCDGNDDVMGQDVCHNNPYMFNGQKQWARWMKDTVGNVSGFRLDAVKHYSWNMSREFGYIGSCVGEFWAGREKILEYINYTGNYAFDFPLYEALKGNAAAMDGAGLVSDKAVTFVDNHDIRNEGQDIWHKHRAYGFIMYIPSIPCVFWPDWFNPDLQPSIQRAMTARKNYDFYGTHTKYKRDNFIIFANNTPVYGCFNSDWSTQSQSIMAMPNSVFTPIAWGPGEKPADTASDKYGNVVLSAPGEGYCYWYRDPALNGPKSNFGSVHVRGDNQDVFGSSWGFGNENSMHLIMDYVWRIVINVPAKVHVEYKFAMNESWDVNRGMGLSTGDNVPQFINQLAQHGGNINADLPQGLCIWEYYEDTETSRLYTLDFDGSSTVDISDLIILTDHWLLDCDDPDWCNMTDINQSGTVDLEDYNIFSAFWD